MAERGQFVVLYGVNNIGKSTQMGLFQMALEKMGVQNKRIKYPIYDLEPTGPKIYRVLKARTETLTTLELQKTYAQNRRDYEPTLVSMLASGLLVLSEDYVGTGIAWGVTNGVSLAKMEEINDGLRAADISILLDGPRRMESIEKGHLHEDGGRWEEARHTHLMLAERYGWKVVDGNGTIQEVHRRVMEVFLGVELRGK